MRNKARIAAVAAAGAMAEPDSFATHHQPYMSKPFGEPVILFSSSPRMSSTLLASKEPTMKRKPGLSSSTSGSLWQASLTSPKTAVPS